MENYVREALIGSINRDANKCRRMSFRRDKFVVLMDKVVRA